MYMLQVKQQIDDLTTNLEACRKELAGRSAQLKAQAKKRTEEQDDTHSLRQSLASATHKAEEWRRVASSKEEQLAAHKEVRVIHRLID